VATSLLVNIRSLLMLVLLLAMSGCVTTTDSPFAREADRQKAVENYVKLATAYIAKDNLERARHHLDRALELDSHSAAAHAAMGLVYNAEGEVELAEESFRRAIREDSDYTRGRVYYGAFLFSEGRYEDAREQFRVAARDTEYEGRDSVFFNLGMTEEQLGAKEDAAEAYHRAVELSRGDARSLLALSRVLVELGQFDRASRYYTRLATIIQRNPRMAHSAESLYTGIRIARHFGNKDQEASLAMLLKNEYPDSAEYQQYKVLIVNDH